MWDDLIRTAAAQHVIPEAWIRAVIEVESSWNSDAYRAEPKIHDASYGLMQLLEQTARGLGFTGPKEDLFLPEVNIPLGAQLLGDLRRKYGDDFRRIYSAYNSGRPDLWETSTQVANNVKRALAALEKYLTEAAQTITGKGGEAIAGLIVLVLLWAWAGKRR
jgi:soluble lytic murein transglycosylase-like protein